MISSLGLNSGLGCFCSLFSDHRSDRVGISDGSVITVLDEGMVMVYAVGKSTELMIDDKRHEEWRGRFLNVDRLVAKQGCKVYNERRLIHGRSDRDRRGDM